MNIENGRSKDRELSSSKQRNQEIVEICVTRDIRKKKKNCCKKEEGLVMSRLLKPSVI